MGNCCSGTGANFQGEGRTLGASPADAPARPTNASAAPPSKITSATGGRTLGRSPKPTGQSHTPGEAAARAAEDRLKASQSKGKLGRQLDVQKAQTHTGNLAQTARDNVAARDADAAAEARTWN